MPNKTRWAIVGSGFISNTMVTAIRSTGRSEIVAITGRDSGRVEAFRSAHDIPLGTTDVTQTVTSREIDAIYVATPNHAQPRSRKDFSLKQVDFGNLFSNDGDHLTILNVFREFEKRRNSDAQRGKC